MSRKRSDRKISPKTKQHTTLEEKLNPNRYPDMPCAVAAMVGFVIGASFNELRIVEMTVTSDWIVRARIENEVARNYIVGHYDDLLHDWVTLLDAAHLTPSEKMEAQCLFAKKIGYLDRVDA